MAELKQRTQSTAISNQIFGNKNIEQLHIVSATEYRFVWNTKFILNLPFPLTRSFYRILVKFQAEQQQK